MPTVIHVSPHPDDESIAAPCTLLDLQRNGWNVINYAVSLGRVHDRERRREELQRALAHTRVDGRAGFRNITPYPPIGISRGDDLRAASQLLAARLRDLIDAEHADLIIGPHPRDGHHGHVTVGRAIRQALWTARRPPVWWMWSIWSDLTRPTLIVDCRVDDLARSDLMLKEYEGENRRSNYLAGNQSRRVTNAVFGVEKTLGWGSAPLTRLAPITHAELLTELRVRRTLVTGLPRTWMIGRPRVLDPAIALATDWRKLEDFSILSPTRFRRFLRPAILSWLSRGRWALTSSDPEPLPDPIDESTDGGLDEGFFSDREAARQIVRKCRSAVQGACVQLNQADWWQRGVAQGKRPSPTDYIRQQPTTEPAAAVAGKQPEMGDPHDVPPSTKARLDLDESRHVVRMLSEEPRHPQLDVTAS